MARYGFNIGLDGHRIQPLTEKEAEEIADGLTIIYGEARERMLKSVANRVARGVTRYGWAERKANEVLGAHAQLSRDLDRAHAQRESLLSGVIDRAYVTGSQQFYADMRSILGDSAHISPNSMKTGYILADLNNSRNAAERRILRLFDDRYADVIGAVSFELATGDMTAKQAVGEALQRFADQGITGFIDRGGHHWTLESYSEMAVLTAIERSTISGYVDTMQSYGYDLAVIDGHIGSCPICEAWEGVIISVSGNDPNYPSLNEAEGAGCFHPRCMHGIHTYYEGITNTPAGGFRDAPREMRPPSVQYTARSKLRYMERMAQKYRDRALVAQTPQQKAQANAKAREWSAAANRLNKKQYAPAQEWNQYKSSIRADVRAADRPSEEVKRAVGETLKRVIDDWPQLGQHLQEVLYGYDDQGAFAASRNDGKAILLDAKHFTTPENLARLFLQSVAAGDTVGANNPMFIVAHECGHCLESMVAMKRAGITEIHSMADKYAVDAARTSMWIEYYQHMGFSSSMTYEEIIMAVREEMGSIGTINASEMLAQSFALQYYGDGPHEHADALIDYFGTMVR